MQAAFPTMDSRVLPLFEGIPGARGMVIAALEGMGRVWTDSPVYPRCAVAAAGDFLFCGGEPGGVGGTAAAHGDSVGKTYVADSCAGALEGRAGTRDSDGNGHPLGL